MLTKTPFMAKSDLYKISGHWYHYRDGMFIMGDPDDEENEALALRPMTCPFQFMAYLNKSRSYLYVYLLVQRNLNPVQKRIVRRDARAYKA